MLTHPTLEKLKALKFIGMLKALTEQLQMPDIQELSFEERLGLLVDREMTERENHRLQTRLRKARLRQSACLEDIDYRHPRALDKALMASLSSCKWVAEHLNVLITGPHWRRENLDSLRPGSKGLPGRFHRSVPAPAQAHGRATHR
jgi:DNA replication protein DnaC